MWQTKCDDRDAAMFHAQLQHRVARQHRAKEASKSLLSLNSESWRAQVVTLSTKAHLNARKLQECLSSVAKNHNLAVSDVRVLAVANWAAPSLLQAEGQRQQASLLAIIVNMTESQNIGLVLTPGHVNKKGMLWKEEEECRKLIVNSNLNSDYHFAMCFAGRGDIRDQRTGGACLSLFAT